MPEYVSAEERQLAQQRATLMEMWYSLEPGGRLQIIGALTGDPTVLEFLKGMAASQSAEEVALEKLRAESREHDKIHPRNIPVDAEVLIYLSNTERVNDCGGEEEVAALPYDRLIIARYLGDGTLKVLAEEMGNGLEVSDEEDFRPDDVVRVGAIRVGRKGRTSIEDVCRYDESLGISVAGNSPTLLTAFTGDEQLHLVLNHLTVNDETILPYIGP